MLFGLTRIAPYPLPPLQRKQQQHRRRNKQNIQKQRRGRISGEREKYSTDIEQKINRVANCAIRRGQNPSF